MDLIAAIKIKVSLGTGPACGPPKRKCGWKERRRGRQSVVPVARLGTVVSRFVVGQEARPGQMSFGGVHGTGTESSQSKLEPAGGGLILRVRQAQGHAGKNASSLVHQALSIKLQEQNCCAFDCNHDNAQFGQTQQRTNHPAALI